MTIINKTDSVDTKINKLNQKIKDLAGLTIFLFVIIACLFLFMWFHATDHQLHKQAVTKQESFKMDYTLRSYPIQDKIMCEPGVDIQEYQWLKTQTLYSCLQTGCPGVGKFCIRSYQAWE